jgi:hypothetical protein
MLSVYPPPPHSSFEWLNQSFETWCVDHGTGPSKWCTSYIPPISLGVYMCSSPIVARQRLGKVLARKMCRKLHDKKLACEDRAGSEISHTFSTQLICL